MTITRRAVATFLATMHLGALTAAPANAADNVRFILDWAFQSQHAMFAMPVDDGTYAKLGLNVTIDRGAGSGDAVAKVASGAYDMGIADIYSMIRFNAENPGHKLIAVMMVDDKSALSVATKATSAIKTPQDLVGKSIADPVGDASRQLFPLFAAATKIDEKSIKWINVSPELRETLLLRGGTDAIAGHVTTVLMNFRNIGVKASEIRIMPFVDYGVNLYGHALIVKPDFATKNPEIVRNFIRGSVRGLNAAMANPDAAVASIKKRDPLINAELEKDRLKMSLDYRMISDNVLKNGMSNVDINRLETSIKDVAVPFGIKQLPAVSEVYTDRYLPPRADLMIQR